MVGAILLTQARNRPFAVTAVLTGFVFCLFGTTLTAHIATAVMSPYNESGARYTALPIFLIECVAVVGVDYVLRQRASARSDARAAHGGTHRRPGIALRSVMAVLAVVVVLSASWVFDFRYAGWRSFASWGVGTDRGELGARLPAVDVGRDQRGAARPLPRTPSAATGYILSVQRKVINRLRSDNDPAIFLIECIAVVGADYFLRQRSGRVPRRRRRPAPDLGRRRARRRPGGQLGGRLGTRASAATRPGTRGQSRPTGSTRARSRGRA